MKYKAPCPGCGQPISIRSAKGWDTHLYLGNSHSWQDYEVSVRVRIAAI